MAHVPLLPPASASREVQAIYEDFHRRMSFPAPPNFILTQGHSPTVAQGTWDVVRGVLVSGKLPRWMKEMMFVAISNDRQCRYCTAAHVACCRMLGVKPESLSELVGDPGSISDPKLRDVILFSIKCSRDPQSLAKADFEILYKHGFTQSEVVEMIGMSALAVYANIIADATAMEQDEMFGQL